MKKLFLLDPGKNNLKLNTTEKEDILEKLSSFQMIVYL